MVLFLYKKNKKFPLKNYIIKIFLNLLFFSIKKVSILKKIKSSIGQFFLKKDLQKSNRIRKPMSFSNVKTIGLLYIVPEEHIFPVITEFVKFLQDNNKIVKALGFTNTDYIPHYCFPKLTYDYFTKKNINWYGKPTHKFVDDFVNTDFDLMIDLHTSGNFTIQYIGYLCQSKFKVGKMSPPNLNNYDLMMNVAEEIELKEYIEQIKHYITQINISSNEQEI